MSASSALEVAILAGSLLDRLGIRYVVVGSVASSIHGEPRATLDIDITLLLESHEVPILARALGRDFHLDERSLREAARTGFPCNAIHRASTVKLDLYVVANEGLNAAEFERAREVRLTGEAGSEVRVSTPEGVVLQKLAWYRKGGEVSDRQWRDVMGVLKTQGKRLDRDYLARWAGPLGVQDLLERALRQAEL